MKDLQFRGVVGGYRAVAAGLLLLFVTAFLAFHAIHQPSGPKSGQTATSQSKAADIVEAYGKLPITFEKNQGQVDPKVKFLARGSGYALFLTESEAVLRLKGGADPTTTSQQQPGHSHNRAVARTQGSVIRMSLVGSASNPQVEGLEFQASQTNYLIGNNPARWHRGVPSYGRVRYRDVYPGIDAIYYGNQRQLETDFVVAPGSRPRDIAIRIDGSDGIRLDHDGDLIVGSAAGDLTLRRPTAYQEIGGTRLEIAANFALHGTDELAVEVGTYDSTRPLVIDPVIVYSTYLGGSNPGSSLLAITEAAGVAVDSSGDAYVIGTTDTLDFPTTNGAYSQNTSGGGFITKFNPTGTGLVYSTFLGGSKGAGMSAIAVDSSGDVYVTGGTVSTDFPVTTSAIQSVYPPGNLEGTVYFAKLDPTGSTLLYATYLGGNGYQDTPYGIALDSNNDAYIVGSTSSGNFLTTATALQRTNNSADVGSLGGNNVFVSRIDPTQVGLNGLVYSTYLGGSGDDNGSAIAVDANFNAYITGEGGTVPTSSNAFQTSSNGGATAFVARIDTVNSVLVYSSFIGSSGPQQAEPGNCIAIDSNGNAYIGGQTFDTNFPVTTGAFETTFPGNSGIGTGYVAKFNTTAATGPTSLVWATYLGGTISGDQPHAIALDSLGNIYLAGETWSGEIANNEYPATIGAPQGTGVAGYQNGLVTVMTPDGSGVTFSTYYGTGGASTNTNVALGLALSTASPPDVFIVGLTREPTKFPISAGSYQTQLNGLIDAFVAELSPAAAQGVFASPTSLAFGNQAKGTTSASQAVTLTNNTPSSLTGVTISFTGTNKSDFAETDTCGTEPATLASGTICTINVTFTPSTTSSESATLSIADSASSSPQTVTLTGTGTQPPPGVTLTPSSGNFGSFTIGTPSSPQTFTLSNNSTAAITINSPGITITGANASDFVIQSTSTCPAVNGTLAASTTCMINIVFTPSINGNESATLSVSDSDSSSPQTATLAGSGTAPSGIVSLAPSTLGFGNVNLNSTSPAQTATLSNTKTTALTINSVTITGANASDFAQSNTCGTSLVASTGTCTISVKFTPTTTSLESATLTVSDSDSTSPQTVALSGTGVATGPDFTISATPSTATVGTHGTVTATINVNSIDGFASSVALNCASLPGDSMCTFTQSPLTPAANSSASTMVTITTSAGVFASTPASWPRLPSRPAWIGLLGILALATLTMRRFSGRSARRALCAFALLSVVTLASCTGTPSTPTGTYTVKLIGTAGASTHAFSFVLTVK